MPLVAEVLNHWAHTFQDFSLSAKEFYETLQKRVEKQKMPDTKTGYITHKEGGVFSASREYFRVQHRNLVFDICAAPFGTNFFISWWLFESEGSLRRLFKNTKIGNLVEVRAARRTFFQMDAEQMFKECIHDCVLEAITEVTEGKGLRLLTDAEKNYKSGGL